MIHAAILPRLASKFLLCLEHIGDRTGPNSSAIDCTLLSMQLLESQSETSSMQIADLILPVFAVILTGWIVGYTGYLSRSLSDALIHFAYNIAMPALLIVTIAQEPSHSLINWRFLVAFGGGSLLCFLLVFGIMSIRASRSVAGGDCNGIRGRCDVSSSCDPARTWSAGCAWLSHGSNGHG